jgi:RNA polymerase sigma-70 factor (ECF subfamily)
LDEETRALRDAQQGSVEAFSTLVRLNQGRVRAYIGRFVRQQDIVDDLAQDVFFAAYKSLNTYDGRCALSTWLLGIARHRALNHLRNEASRQAHESGRFRAVMDEWRVESAEALPDDSADTEHRALAECITGLPENSSKLLAEYYYNNRTSGDIAKELGKSESSIRMTLLRIRQSLRACVERKLQFGKTANG